MQPLLIILLVLLRGVTAKTISNVFTSLSFANVGTNTPQSLNTATLGWSLSPAQNAQIGDTFSLTMNNVYRTRFGTSQVLRLTVQGNEIARCSPTYGSYRNTQSSLSCVVLSPVSARITGTVSFSVIFGAGGSANSAEIQGANTFRVGANTISWNNGQLSTSMNFVAGAYYPQSSTTDAQFYLHTTGYNAIENIVISDACASNYIYSSTLTLTYGSAGVLDCSMLQVYMTNSLNDWLMPRSYSPVQNLISRTCSGKTITVRTGALPAGYRVFITSFLTYDQDTDSTFSPSFTYSNDIRCGASQTRKSTTPINRSFNIVLGSSSSDGNSDNLRK